MSDEQAQPKIDGRAGNGGARPGAGRKPRAVTYAGPITQAEELAGSALVDRIQNLIELGDGGYERVTHRYEPAGLVLLDLPLRDADGQPMINAKTGQPILAKQPAFPDAKPTDMVLVEQRIETADKDRQANIWVAEFIAGKTPTRDDDILKYIDLSKLTPAQLERVANGDDLIAILLEG